MAKPAAEPCPALAPSPRLQRRPTGRRRGRGQRGLPDYCPGASGHAWQNPSPPPMACSPPTGHAATPSSRVIKPICSRTQRGNRIMSFFDTLQEATHQERHALFNLPIIRDALEGKVSPGKLSRISRPGLLPRPPHRAVDDGLRRACPRAWNGCARPCASTSRTNTATNNGCSTTSPPVAATRRGP
jgi:hypothetical protein